jgi:hypothetical protein
MDTYVSKPIQKAELFRAIDEVAYCCAVAPDMPIPSPEVDHDTWSTVSATRFRN